MKSPIPCPTGAPTMYMETHLESLPLGAISWMITGAIHTSPASPIPLSIRPISSIQKAKENPHMKLEIANTKTPDSISHMGLKN